MRQKISLNYFQKKSSISFESKKSRNEKFIDDPFFPTPNFCESVDSVLSIFVISRATLLHNPVFLQVSFFRLFLMHQKVRERKLQSTVGKIPYGFFGAFFFQKNQTFSKTKRLPYSVLSLPNATCRNFINSISI